MTFRSFRVFAVLFVMLGVSIRTFGQTSPGAQSPPPIIPYGTVTVYLRTPDGRSLPDTAVPLIHLASIASGTPLPNFPTRSGEAWAFTGILGGYQYEVRVTANGYSPASATVNLPSWPGAMSSVIIFLKPLGDKLAVHPPGGSFILAPEPAKEIERALNDLNAHHVSSAKKHAKRAMKLAPTDPYVQYVMGMIFMDTGQFAEAKPYLEKSVSINPRAPAYLIALGTVRLRLGDDAGAVEMLSKAAPLAPKSWKTEWLLAAAYLGEKNYGQARDHANEAMRIGKRDAQPVEFLLGAAFAGLGDRPAAANMLDNFAKEFPSNPNASKALAWAKMLRAPSPMKAQPSQVAVLPVTARLNLTPELNSPSAPSIPQPPPEVPPSPNWAPPDVDAAKPFVIASATCPLQQVLRGAGEKAEQLVASLQEFSATEDFQAIELKHGDELEKPQEEQYQYLVLIHRTSPTTLSVKEVREKDSVPARLPGRISAVGTAALALAFHPIIQKDLDWKCEGLGTWDRESAWVIHFQQKANAPNVLAWFFDTKDSYPLPLKGRAWVSEQSDQVIHLDTDLVGPIKAIDLQREHYSIDYKAVPFRKHNVRLWLPEVVNAYVQYQGHFYHYYHRYTDFKLFWVATKEKIGSPKEKKTQRP